MLEHVRRRAMLSMAFAEVIVATCDREIAEGIERFGGKVIMTSPAHPAATDRVSEAMQHVECTHVVNVQGDEILVLPNDLKKMVEAIVAEPSTSAWNAIATIDDRDELSDRSIVKCVVSRSNRILYCSRDFPLLPFHKDGAGVVRKILGILAYERSFLDRYGRLERTPLETAESIDQSRIVEHDVFLQGVSFTHGYPGINEPREVPVVEGYLRQDPLQRAVLSEILQA